MRRRQEKRPRGPRKPGWRDPPDWFWAEVEPLLPPALPKGKRGQQPAERHDVFNGIVYVLRTGCQWKLMPREYPSGCTCHRYFQRWVKKRVFLKLWGKGLQEYDERIGIDWEWQAIDSVTVQAPVKGGISQGKTPPIGGR